MLYEGTPCLCSSHNVPGVYLTDPRGKGAPWPSRRTGGRLQAEKRAQEGAAEGWDARDGSMRCACVCNGVHRGKAFSHELILRSTCREWALSRPAPAWGRIPDEPQSQHTSFPGSRWTSSMMAFVRSSKLFSPVLCSPRKAMVRASSLLLVSTDIHLRSGEQGRRPLRVWPWLSPHCKQSSHQELPRDPRHTPRSYKVTQRRERKLEGET